MGIHAHQEISLASHQGESFGSLITRQTLASTGTVEVVLIVTFSAHTCSYSFVSYIIIVNYHAQILQLPKYQHCTDGDI